MLRVFRSIIPDFARANSTLSGSGKVDAVSMPPEAAGAIRQYISSDVVKACISSIHEPYFVDLQKDYASLMATIVVAYSRLTPTARDVLVSLPNIKQTDVDNAIEYMMRKEVSSRSQRGVILQLLGDLKGVSVSEMGKLSKSIGIPSTRSNGSSRRPTRSKMAQQFMTAPAPDHSQATPRNSQMEGNGDHLEGVSSLFDS